MPIDEGARAQIQILKKMIEDMESEKKASRKKKKRKKKRTKNYGGWAYSRD